MGYNVYRCVAASCTYAKMNSSLDYDASFTDNGVAPVKRTPTWRLRWIRAGRKAVTRAQWKILGLP